ncbi:MAG: hypothetical protein ACOX9A_01280 [Anaerolineae bacterium]|jgi:hypothetical protein
MNKVRMIPGMILVCLIVGMLTGCEEIGLPLTPSGAEAALPTVESSPEAPSAPLTPEVAPPGSPPDGLTRIYMDEQVGFSLRLPPDWAVSEPQPGPMGAIYLIGPEPLRPVYPGQSVIIVVDANGRTREDLAEAICGPDCVDPPLLQEYPIASGIMVGRALIGGEGIPMVEWFFYHHGDFIIGWTIHDPDSLETLDAIAQSFTPGAIIDAGTEGFPAAQVVRRALAHKLDVHPYSIVLTDVQAVEWPDRCMGIYIEGIACTQQIVPGYRVGVWHREQRYAYHTDVDGDILLRVPGAASRPGGVAIIWETATHCVAAMMNLDGAVRYGACEGVLDRATLSEEQMQDLAEFAVSFMPFYAEMPAGAIGYAGLGENMPVDSERRMISEWARLVAEGFVVGEPGDGAGLALTWQRMGGDRGYCDALSIFRSGFYEATTCENGRDVDLGRGRLNALQLEQLYGRLDDLSPFEVERRDDDVFTYLAFGGQGNEQAPRALREDILDMVEALYQERLDAQEPGGADSSAPTR